VPLFLDRVQQAVSGSPGTGAITLGAAASGMQTYAQAGASNGMLVNYVLTDGTAWEYGVGTYGTSGPSLARTTIAASSNGGAAINASASAVVYCDAFAANLNSFQNLTQVRANARRAVIRYSVR
jgi:hypothetical protein